MEIIESAWYGDFRCQAGECSESCCTGWLVPLSEEDKERFAGEKGALGRKLKFEMALSGGEQFNAFARRCAFLNRKGLCALQECKGESFIPEACRNYPRFYRNYGLFEERCIDLSCVHGARMFLQAHDPLYRVSSEGKAKSRPCGTNDDVKFLKELRALRETMIRALGEVCASEEFSKLLGHFFCYCEKAQEAFARGQTDYFSENPFTPDGDFEGNKELHGKDTGKEIHAMFPFPAARIEALLGTAFYHFRLRFRSRMLYELCRLYFGKYAGLIKDQAKWNDLFQTFIHRYPQRVRYYADIYGYYLLQYFLEGYEDYSFRRHAGLGIVHVNMLLFFEILYEKEYGEPGKDMRAKILSAYVRRAYYNSGVLEELYAAGFTGGFQ